MQFPFSEEALLFMREHAHHDPATLMLQARRFPHLPMADLVQQIQARQKAQAKLPRWANNPSVVFPPNLSVEQASSEQTAQFKASLVSGRLLVDLTGGFGIDTTFFAGRFATVQYVERQAQLVEVVRHNAHLLGLSNINFFHAEAAQFLQELPEEADCIFLDPARRDTANQKVHRLEDCEPDVLRLLPLLLEKGKSVLLKTSPMLDIDLALRQLGQVQAVWVVAVENECKEVLYLLSRNPTTEPTRHTVNLLRSGEEMTFSFLKSAEEAAEAHLSEPLSYLYEPNAAILKAGAFKKLAEDLHLTKLHPSSHLYTSAALEPNFPGRSFRITAVARYDKKALRQLLPDQKANITVRNFPDSVAAIRKKTGLKEGGDTYLFATTDLHQKHLMIICQKA